MNAFDSSDLWTLFFPPSKPALASEPKSSTIEMQIFLPPKSDIPPVIKQRQKDLSAKFSGIATLCDQLPDSGIDMRNVLQMIQNFLDMADQTQSAEPLYGQDIQHKVFRQLLDISTVRQLSDLYSLHLTRRGSTVDHDPLNYLFFSEWDSHQLFSALDLNNQVVVVEKIVRLALHELLMPHPAGFVLSLAKPIQYPPKEWEKALLEYLKAKQVFVEQTADDEVKYHLNLSGTLSGPAMAHNLYKAVENYQPFHHIDLSYNQLDLKTSQILRPLVRSAQNVDLSHSTFEHGAEMHLVVAR